MAFEYSPDRSVAIALFDGNAGAAWQAGEARSGALPLLCRLLADETKPKATADVKSLLVALARKDLPVRGFRDDVALYEFLLSADPSACSLDQLVQRRLDLTLDATAAGQALQILDLNEMLGNQITARGFRKVYDEIDLPLAGVLARMEIAGIRVDAEELGRLSGLMEIEIARLTREICEMAGCDFNISSPQQLGKILFDTLGLPAPVKYGKGKTISTAADVLEGLAAEYPIAGKVLEYRQLSN